MIAALFIDERGGYVGRSDVDAWGRSRDARTYAGEEPVVAHPPCGVWCQLASVNAKRYGRAVGDDGGCFASALANVRRCGGVLEHPALSKAWAHFCLMPPLPLGAGWRVSGPGEWVCAVSQAVYGHLARKMTWLLYVGACAPFELDWRSPEPTHVVSYLRNNGGRDLPRLTKKQARATPAPFREVLIALALNSARGSVV